MAFDQTKPIKTDNFDTGVLSSIRSNFLAAALLFESATVTFTGGTPTGTKRFNNTSGLLEYYTGSAWAELATGYLKNVAPTGAGSVAIAGSVGGYAGVQFTAGTKLYTLMCRAADGLSGIYSVTDSAWIWYFDASGALAAGSVPWSKVTSAPTITGLTADTGATANTVARRDANGDLFARYLNQGSSNGENPTIGQVLVTNGTDNYARKSSLANFGSQVPAAWGNVTGKPTTLGGYGISDGITAAAVAAGYAALASGPTFTGTVKGNSGTKGLGAITVTTTTGTPSGGADGDFTFVY